MAAIAPEVDTGTDMPNSDAPLGPAAQGWIPEIFEAWVISRTPISMYIQSRLDNPDAGSSQVECSTSLTRRV